MKISRVTRNVCLLFYSKLVFPLTTWLAVSDHYSNFGDTSSGELTEGDKSNVKSTQNSANWNASRGIPLYIIIQWIRI